MSDLLEYRRDRVRANASRPLTHSLDLSKEGLAVDATREVWKPFPRDVRYEVSTAGVVRRKDTGRIRKPVRIPNGYLTLVLTLHGHSRCFYLHRMVFESHMGAIPEGMHVRHMSGVKSDNRLSNLALGSAMENIADKKRHGTEPVGAFRWSAKITDIQAADIRSREGQSCQSIADEFGVSASTVSRIRRGVTGHLADQSLPPSVESWRPCREWLV